MSDENTDDSRKTREAKRSFVRRHNAAKRSFVRRQKVLLRREGVAE